jgi:hypothetical protein
VLLCYVYHLDNIQSVSDNRAPSVKVASKQTWNEQRFLDYGFLVCDVAWVGMGEVPKLQSKTSQ